MIRRPPRSTRKESSAASDVYKRQAMYEQYEAFDELEEQFMDMEEYVTAKLAEYVDEHLEYFAEIV